MGEAETIPIDLQDSRLERGGQSGLCPVAGGRLDKAQRRVGERGNDPRNLEPASPEAVEALVNELFQIRGNRQLLTRVQPAPPSLNRARELEGEEWISARRFPDAQERRSGKDGADARSQQLAERADAERAELDGQEPLLRQSPPQPERHLVASGQDCGDGLLLEAGQSEPEHRLRRCVAAGASRGASPAQGRSGRTSAGLRRITSRRAWCAGMS